MASIDDLIANIRSGPSGPRVGAVFDFEGTLVERRSVGSPYTSRQRRFENGPDECVRAVRAGGDAPLTEETFTDLLGHAVQGWAGRTQDELREVGEQLFSQQIGGALFHDAWRLIRAHQNRGHTVVITTSGTQLEVEPMARELGIDHILHTELETENDVLTGRVAGRTLWAEGKLAAVRRFARRQRFTLRDSHAYANSDDDIPLLNAVGSPHAVNPAPLLSAHARQQGWSTLRFATRRSQLDPVPVIRTAAMFGSLLAAAGVGTVAGVLTNDRRRGVDVATSVFGRVAGPVGNITIDVTGRHHARSHRPAVFFVNHQSTLIDVLVTSRVLERGFTIVVKAEIKKMPVIGPMFDLAGVAFVDRSNTSKAISALASAVDKLRGGVSIAMAPEGTRSMSPKIGPFKKGGFHLARDAGVPIVPIVIRNAGEIMWRNAMIAQSGTIAVAVHEPLPTAGWGRDDIDRWLPRMHQLYVDTLDDWPGVHAGQRWSDAIAAAASSGD